MWGKYGYITFIIKRIIFNAKCSHFNDFFSFPLLFSSLSHKNFKKFEKLQWSLVLCIYTGIKVCMCLVL